MQGMLYISYASVLYKSTILTSFGATKYKLNNFCKGDCNSISIETLMDDNLLPHSNEY